MADVNSIKTIDGQRAQRQRFFQAVFDEDCDFLPLTELHLL
jgi:hypothetical protein